MAKPIADMTLREVKEMCEEQDRKMLYCSECELKECCFLLFDMVRPRKWDLKENEIE